MTTSTSARQLLLKASRSRIHLVILLLGFSSGLPAAMTASTLQAWFTESGLNLYNIGAVTLLVLPYSTRFLWAPLFDFYTIPGFDRRRGWLLLTQMGVIAGILSMGMLNPHQTFNVYHFSIPWLMLAGFITAFISASQDIIIGAYQTEIFPPEQYGISAALYVIGWRMSAIISGAFALILASQIGWQQTYFIMASLIGVGIVATCMAPATDFHIENTLSRYKLMAPFTDLFNRYGFKTAALFFILIVTYKAGDALAMSLTTTFLLRHIGFDLATVGLINKTIGLVASLLGGLIAGYYMTRISLYKALLWIGVIQGVANLSYALMSLVGKSYVLLIFTAVTENFCSGMGTLALLTFIMMLCNMQFTATQFAFLSAIAFIFRTIAGPLAASLVQTFGWTSFFVWCFIISLPPLFFVYINKNVILNLKQIDEEKI